MLQSDTSRNPHPGQFTLRQEEAEPFASLFPSEKLKGEVTFRRGLLSPHFSESNIALVGEGQALRSQLAAAKACREAELQRTTGSDAVVQDSNKLPISCSSDFTTKAYPLFLLTALRWQTMLAKQPLRFLSQTPTGGEEIYESHKRSCSKSVLGPNCEHKGAPRWNLAF